MIKEFKHEDRIIKIDHNKCNGSGECVNNCPTDVYELKDGKAYVTNIEACIDCCLCVQSCPTDAIEHSVC